MAAGIDLVTLSRVHGIPYGTLARWAHSESWPIVRRRNRHLGTRQLYCVDAATDAVVARQDRDREQRAA